MCAVHRCIDGCESQCCAWKGGNFIYLFFLRTSTLLFLIFWPHEEFFIIAFQRFLAKKRICSAYFVTLKNIKIRYCVVDVL